MTQERIRVENVVKLFGDDEQASLRLLQEGASKAEILERSGAVLGLDRVSFSVNEGEILVVMGLSGSGKSTMLRCLNRLVEPTAGSIRVDGTEVTALSKKDLLAFRREKFGMVFQHFALFPNRTIAENVEYGLEVQGVKPGERRARSMEAIELVGLKGWDAKYPSQLSGGMQQRAGLARALAVDADILLMDEAFSALDPLIRREMQDELVALQGKMRKTIVFVSHDLDEAIHLGGRIVLMKDGAIVQEGYPEEILRAPATEYVARFVEHIDVSSVLTIGGLVDAAQPAIARDATGRDAAARFAAHPHDRVVVTCERSMPVGTLARARLSAMDPEAAVSSFMSESVSVARGETVLKAVLPRLSAEPHGIAVVDADGRYLGVLTQAAVLAALAGGRPANAGDPGQEAGTAQEEGKLPWTGPSPNSLSTTFRTPPSSGSPATSPT